MVGVHWRGTGTVRFRTRSAAGRWSAWQTGDADTAPDRSSGENRLRSWHLGNLVWTGASRAIRFRTVGAVTALRAYYVWSPPELVPMRRLALANAPPIIPRLSWGANESIRREPPHYAAAVAFAVVHHTAGTNNYTEAQSAAIVRGIELYHVQGNGWNDIGYNFLVDKYGQIFEGRYGGIDRPVVGAHSLGFNSGSVGISVLGSYDASPISAAAKSALEQLLAWRLDVAHVDPLSTLTWPSALPHRDPGLSARHLRPPGHELHRLSRRRPLRRAAADRQGDGGAGPAEALRARRDRQARRPRPLHRAPVERPAVDGHRRQPRRRDGRTGHR
jgi:hypothetical protein